VPIKEQQQKTMSSLSMKRLGMLIPLFASHQVVDSFPKPSTSRFLRRTTTRLQQQQKQPFSLNMSAASESFNNKILVVGSANQDLTSNSDVLPTLGETVMGKEFATTCGGKGANQAVAAGMLGLAPGNVERFGRLDYGVWIRYKI
jgi:hypothetical protein